MNGPFMLNKFNFTVQYMNILYCVETKSYGSTSVRLAWVNVYFLIVVHRLDNIMLTRLLRFLQLDLDEPEMENIVYSGSLSFL
jgi:hypothetical protein